jgi:GH24 family phage-related lysozyme (muramidase)
VTIKSSQAAVDLIVTEEVSSKAVYQAKYTHPEWPGGASGVTIGIGYDCGYSTANTIQGDWGDKLPAAMVQALQHVAGIHGSPASSHAHELRGVVTVPWEAAMAVFIGRDMPKWEGIVERALPNTNLLNSDSFGALVSLAFNRGPSFDNRHDPQRDPQDRYREMRAIKACMGARDFGPIPGEFRAMKRLWPNASGLQHRRDHEADLFQKGLSA